MLSPAFKTHALRLAVALPPDDRTRWEDQERDLVGDYRAIYERRAQPAGTEIVRRKEYAPVRKPLLHGAGSIELAATTDGAARYTFRAADGTLVAATGEEHLTLASDAEPFVLRIRCALRFDLRLVAEIDDPAWLERRIGKCPAVTGDCAWNSQRPADDAAAEGPQADRAPEINLDAALARLDSLTDEESFRRTAVELYSPLVAALEGCANGRNRG